VTLVVLHEPDPWVATDDDVVDTFCRVPETGVAPCCPTKSHVLAEVQFRAPTAVTPAGKLRLVHVIPPSSLAHAGAAVPLSDAPLTTQPLPSKHEIAFRVEEPSGVGTEAHVAPPSDVATSTAPAFLSVMPCAFEPIATQTFADAHDTERSIPVPPFTNLGVQVWPLSVLTRI
jgi:hypothetical protein